MSNEYITELRKQYGLTIRVLRTKKQLTQTELGELCGVTKQTINKIELGKFPYSFDLVLKIGQALGFCVDFHEETLPPTQQ